MAKDEKISYYWKLAEPIIEKYFKYFQCIRKTNPKSFYDGIILGIINIAIKDNVDEISFKSYIENEIIIALRNNVIRRKNNEPILEAFLCAIRQEYPDNHVKIIEEFDKLLELLFGESLDIASKLMKRGTTLYNIMLIIQESHEIEKVTKDDPERDNGVINSYLELFEEKKQTHIDKSESDHRIRYQYVMSHLREPSFTEEKMIDIGRRILHGDKDAKEELIKSECKLVKMIADEYKDYSFNSTLLIAAGYNALVTSADEYDYTEGVKFRTFASIRIKRAIEKQIIYEWKRTIGFDERCAKIEELEEELLKKGKELTGEEIEKRLGISNGDRVLKIYRLMNAYKEYEKTRFDRGENNESNSKIKKSASIQELLEKMKKLITVDSQYYELFVLKQGLQDGLLRSDSEVASQLGIDPSKIRTYRIAVETAINNNSEARNIYKLIVSKRNQAVDSLRSRLKETVLEKAGIASSTDISENDRDLIILHKRNVTIKEIAIYFQNPCDMIQKRIEELSGNILKGKNDRDVRNDEDNNMGRTHNTPEELVDTGTTREKDSYNASIVSMNNLTSNDHCNSIPEGYFNFIVASFTQGERDILNRIGLEKIRINFPADESITMVNVREYLKKIIRESRSKEITGDSMLLVPKRKRGRPPKNQSTTQTVYLQELALDNSKKEDRTNDDSKTETANVVIDRSTREDNNIVPKRRRGRPPKNQSTTQTVKLQEVTLDNSKKEDTTNAVVKASETDEVKPIKKDNSDINIVPIEEVKQPDANDLSDSGTKSILDSFTTEKLDETREEEKNRMETAMAFKDSKDISADTKSAGIGVIQTVSAMPIIRKSLEEMAQDKIRVTLNSFNPDDRERLIKGLGPNLEKLSLPIRSILEPDTLHSVLVRKLIEFRKEVVVPSHTQEDDQTSNSYYVDRDEEYSIEQFEQALETIKSDPLANEICLSFDTRKAIITRLFFGLDPSYGRKSVEDITNIFNIPSEEVEGTIQEFYETYISRIEETRKTIFGFCKIHTSRQKPKDGKKGRIGLICDVGLID